jgi:hypothetical protein
MPAIFGAVLWAVMHLRLHSITLRMRRVGSCCLALAGLVPVALSQTNLDAEVLPTENLHDLSPLSKILPVFLWCLAGALLVIAAVLFILRERVATSLYKTTSDAHWTDDSQEVAGQRVEVGEVMDACEALKSPLQPDETEEPAAEPVPLGRLFTPASGPAWGESMLKAFLGTCMKVNCLGRTWREAAASQSQFSNLPDPREAELIRRLMQRWHEFHVDPESGVFLDRAASAVKDRVCIIRVSKAKRTLVEAAFNAGFVIESVGRYLRKTDLVYHRGLGDYHAPTKDELTKMTPGEKESMVRIAEVPDPWQAMIGKPNATSPAACGPFNPARHCALPQRRLV